LLPEKTEDSSPERNAAKMDYIVHLEKLELQTSSIFPTMT
jgi:hypothetical protein